MNSEQTPAQLHGCVIVLCSSGIIAFHEKFATWEIDFLGKCNLHILSCCRFERVLGLCADILKRNITQYNSFVSLSV